MVINSTFTARLLAYKPKSFFGPPLRSRIYPRGVNIAKARLHHIGAKEIFGQILDYKQSWNFWK